MAVCTADFELGTNGNSLSTGDTGSATAYNAVSIGGSSTLAYSTTQAAHGTKSVSKTNPAGNQSYFGWDAALGTQSGTWYGRFYLYFTNLNPSTSEDIMMPGNGSYAVGSRGALMQINSVGKLSFQSIGGASLLSTTVFANSQWYRVEWKVVQGTSSSGQIEVKLYTTADSVTAAETLTSGGTSTLASIDHISIGDSRSVTALSMFFDGLVAGATAYPGPFPVNTTAPVISGSLIAGSVLTSTNGAWNTSGTFTYTYQWTRDGSNIGAATASTYTTVNADVGHVVRCVVTATGQQATNENASQASNGITPTPNAPSPVVVPTFTVVTPLIG